MIHQSIARTAERACCPSCGHNLNTDDVCIGDLQVGLFSGCRWRGRYVRLDPMGLYTLHAIAGGRGAIMSHEALQRRNNGCGPAHLKVIISNIKKRIRQVDPDFNHIQNEWGIGYRWGAPQ